MSTDDDELTPQQKFYMESPESTVPRDLGKGRPREEIIADLVRLGRTREAAAAMVDRVAADLERYRFSPEGRRQLARESTREIVGGLVMTLLGIAIGALAVVRLLAPIPLNGVWLILTSLGLIITGLAFAVRGYQRWHTYRDSENATPGEGGTRVD